MAGYCWRTNMADNFFLESIRNDKSGGINHLINGQFAVAQRGTSFTAGSNDDTDYTLDRWKLFSDGNDVVDVTQETTSVPINKQTAIALDVETANKKFGIAQIIEQKNCVNLIGETVTLSFKAKVSATTNLDNVKAAIISWDGTADAPTADMISAWNVEGTDPTLATNFTYENTPANLNLTTSYATYSVTASVDTASVKNIVVFIWSDVTTTSAGEFLYITDVKLEAGLNATPFEHEEYSTTFQKCLRYYEEWGGEDAYQPFGYFEGTGTVGYSVFQFNEKRDGPTVTVSDVAHFQSTRGAVAFTAMTFSQPATTHVFCTISRSTNNWASGEIFSWRANNTTSARIYFNAEL